MVWQSLVPSNKLTDMPYGSDVKINLKYTASMFFSVHEF